MTERQANILKSALKLFAEEGFNATTTKKVAVNAGVSEGLIFRHFVNKDGLLNAVLSQGEDKTKELFNDIIRESNPEKALRKSLEMPFKIDRNKDEKEYWRLQVKLKWEMDMHMSEKYGPLQSILIIVFTKLGYASPVLEAEYLVHCIDGLIGALINDKVKDKDKLLSFIKLKYKV